MRSRKRGKKYTLLYSNGNKCLISNKSSRLCYCATFCSNPLSEICISSQLCISQGYWNYMTPQSRQPHKQCFSLCWSPCFHRNTAVQHWGRGWRGRKADKEDTRSSWEAPGCLEPQWGAAWKEQRSGPPRPTFPLQWQQGPVALRCWESAAHPRSLLGSWRPFSSRALATIEPPGWNSGVGRRWGQWDFQSHFVGS